MTILLRQKPLPQVVRQIVQRDNGAWFDPSDLSTLYQDAAGTTPVTAVEQPVGLMLDKSRGMMLGPELVSNGTFDSGITGWTAGLLATVESSMGLLKVTPTGTAAGYAWTSFQTIIGHTYKLSYTDFSGTSAIGRLRAGNAPDALQNFNLIKGTAPVSGSLVFTAQYDTTYLTLTEADGVAGTYLTIDNISIREIYGYHATQSITASRPVLSARHNLCLSTEDVRSYYLFNAGGSAFGPQTVACDSTNNAGIRAIEFNASSGNIRSGVKVGTYSFSCELRKSAGSAISSVYFNMDQGDCTVSANTVPSGAITLTDSWVKYNGTVTISAVGTVWRVWVYRAGTAPTGNFDIKNIHINEGATLLHYQRVNTSTDYDTDERYFRKFLRFDGVDDYLNLPYMGLYANRSASVVAAYNLRVTGYSEYLISERSSSTTNLAYLLQRKNYSPSNLGNFIRNDAGTILADDNSTKLTPSPVAVISVVDSGSGLSTYVNSKIGGAVAYSRAGVLTPTNTIIGASVSTATGNFANMNLYSLIITKSALTDAQRVKCERYAASKAGVIL